MAAAAKKEAKATPKSKLSRKNKRKLGREKRADRIRSDKEFAKAYFEGRSKRSDDKKTAFRKRHAKKS